ncbi:MAG: RdgB/HAM1 family non-canonical purine NTP pyrophosphatase [Calditrichota bacterium]
MQNIEIKYRVDDMPALRAAIEAHPEAEFSYSHRQEDTYFFTETGRLKIRVEDEKQPHLITYNRANEAKGRISNYELDMLDDVQSKQQELAKQFGVKAIVRKQRTLFLFRNVRIHLDEVEGLGTYMELESVISDDFPHEIAQENFDAIHAIIEPLCAQAESIGYLELTLDAQKNTIVLASRNKHKLQELSAIIGNRYRLLSTDSFSGIPEIEETEKTFEGNALIKARAVFQHCKMPTLADDSGLEVDALDGEPGVDSALYAGEHGNHAANNTKLLDALKNVSEEKRTARFRSVIALITADREVVVEGSIEGRILTELTGKGGFGYDPLFLPNGYTESFAQMSDEMKNSISHRARALEKLKDVL